MAFGPELLGCNLAGNDPMETDLETRVKIFVARERATNLDRLTLDATLLGDLGTDGADGWELVEAFGKEF